MHPRDGGGALAARQSELDLLAHEAVPLDREPRRKRGSRRFGAHAPEESALRLRLADTDCFFSIYSGIAIGTEAERRVTMAFEPRSDDARYNMLVQCMPAMEAAP